MIGVAVLDGHLDALVEDDRVNNVEAIDRPLAFPVLVAAGKQ